MRGATVVRLWLVATVVLGMALGSAGVVFAGSSIAEADPIADCSTTVGAIVVVDFSHWGGAIDRGCDADLSNGYNALHEAGFITEGTQQEGPAFICRIGLASEGASSYEPSPEEDACIDTPPANAYWSYWHADAGQNTWTYTEQGAMDYQPPPGSVDAWVFGGADGSGSSGGPTFPPSAVRATNTSPVATTTTTAVTPTTSMATSTTTTPRTRTSSVMSPPPQRPGPSSGRSTAPTATTRSHEPTTTTSPESSKTKPRVPLSTMGSAKAGTNQKIVTIGPSAAVPKSPSESLASFEIGAGVVVLVAASGGAVAVHRRRGRR